MFLKWLTKAQKIKKYCDSLHDRQINKEREIKKERLRSKQPTTVKNNIKNRKYM